MSKTPTYDVWVNMVQRCHNPKATAYPRYGARGITVCDRWRANFENFLADMGERPEGLSIDRIDNARGYEPGNCRWATMTVQQNNRTNNRRINFNGRTMTLMQLSRHLGIHHKALASKL